MEPNAPRSRHPLWLYEHGNFRGSTVRAVGDVADLGSSGMNDTASSIFISFGNWQFCEDSNYRGRCFILGPGQYSEIPQGMNDMISSFRRVR
jgi:Beta/Gamma crystallin